MLRSSRAYPALSATPQASSKVPRPAQIGVGPLELPADGFAELWFEDMASLQKAAASDAVKTVLKDGTLFVGREVDFVVEEKVIIPSG